MSTSSETFFTVIGCMDGRCQQAVATFGQKKFAAEYPDTITEAGLVGLLAKKPVDQNLLQSIKKKINISLEKHHSKGMIIHGHQECAGNPVDDKSHRGQVRKIVRVIRAMTKKKAPVVGVFVKRSNSKLNKWRIEEL